MKAATATPEDFVALMRRCCGCDQEPFVNGDGPADLTPTGLT
jgi:hypothetical protein